jgi:hypothetical protein
MPAPTPYLVASVAYLLLVFVLAGVTVRRGHARLVVLAAAVHLPATLFVPMLEFGYWSPERTFGGRIGLEDVVVTAAVASWAWYLVAIRFGHRLDARADLRTAFRRSLGPGAAVIAFYLAAWVSGADAMTALLLTCGVAGAVMAWRQPEQRGIALWGAASLGVVWFLLVAGTYAFFPDFVHDWNLAGPWGRRIAGVPLGEIVWAVLFGAFWPLFFGHVFAVRLRPSSVPRGSATSARSPRGVSVARAPSAPAPRRSAAGAGRSRRRARSAAR